MGTYNAILPECLQNIPTCGSGINMVDSDGVRMICWGHTRFCRATDAGYQEIRVEISIHVLFSIAWYCRTPYCHKVEVHRRFMET